IIGIESSSKFSKICEWIASLIFIPDYKILWLPFALSKALQLIDQKKIKNIITTAPPHSTNIIGLLIKLILPEIRWIADFRDTWTENEVYNYPLKIIKKIEEFLELKTLQYADYIVCATDSVKNSFVEKYKLSESKFKVITNGFDEADFNFSDKKIYIQPETKILNIVYSGSLNDWRNLSNFCGALKKLEIEKKIDLTKLHIQLCGHIPAFEHRRIKKLKLQNVFEFINLEPHKESIKRLIAADLLLLIIGEKEGTVVLTGKLFEYIGAARPIFAIVPKNGEAEKLITQNNFGIAANTSSLDEISEKFLEIYNLFFENNTELNFNRDIEIRKKFTRKLLTKKFADLINSK
ncbi:MAG TPA: glycosyltransferase, partial [bacterium]|nr:glycosyltransferase [bacterium]